MTDRLFLLTSSHFLLFHVFQFVFFGSWWRIARFCYCGILCQTHTKGVSQCTCRKHLKGTTEVVVHSQASCRVQSSQALWTQGSASIV